MTQVASHAPAELSAWETQQPLDFMAMKKEYEALLQKYNTLLYRYAGLGAALYHRDPKTTMDFYQLVFHKNTSLSDDVQAELKKHIKFTAPGGN